VRRAAVTGARRFYEFGRFRLDPNRHRLLHNGEAVPLSAKAIETLTALVQNPGKLLEREALMQAVWPDTIVEDANLTVAISQLRKALNQNCDTGEFIQTIPRIGYRFVADVREVVDEPTALVAEGNQTDPPAELDVHKNEPVISVEQSSAERTSGAPSPIERRKLSGVPSKTSWRSPVAVIAILIIGLTTLFFIRSRPASVSSQRSGYNSHGYSINETAQISEKSIAVLPFDNLSDDKQNAFFAAGVQDEIISDLARIADLKVISRTSGNLYKSGNPRNSREIGQQLGVAHLLEGNVQRIGNRLRVNAQLIDTRTDTHSWAQTYDRDVADLFAVQSDIAQAIVVQLRAKISPAEKRAIERPPTADLTAFDLYIHAKNLLLPVSFGANAKDDLLRAADLLNEAVAHDPSFFDAYCQLSLAHGLLYFYGFDHTSARLARAEAALEAASRMRPNAGETHLARARNLYWGYLDYNGALAELDIARQSLPNDSQIPELTGYVERRQGQWEKSIQSLQRALELDPRNFDILQQLALSYGDLARYAEEQSVLDRALGIQPNDAATKAMNASVDLDWKADTRPMHELINEIRVKDAAALQGVADFWLTCALAERDPASASNALALLGENALGDGPIQFSRKFMEGLNARMVNDDTKARLAFTAARAEQEKLVQAQPNYGPPLVVLGLIDAALGRKEEAVREGRHAIELVPIEKDAVVGRIIATYFAMIAAWVGDNAVACEQLAGAVGYTSSLSYGQLKLMPWWDPLRGDPCFEKVVASLAPNKN
jgi:TolB-like protein/DNA-binding winged helix-turn-helix (wHTH) protein/Tfp pilus assembly protein PilF